MLLKGLKKSKKEGDTLRGEKILFYILLFSSLLLSLSIGLTTISQKGIPTLLAIISSLIIFSATASIIILWFIKW